MRVFFQKRKNYKVRPCNWITRSNLVKSALLLLLFVVFLLPTSASALTFGVPRLDTLTSGLVGYWTFDGKDTAWNTNKTLDKSGNGNHGRMDNMSTTTVPVAGKIGQGFSFDGTNDEVEIGAITTVGATGFSFSFWMKLWKNPDGTSVGIAAKRFPSRVLTPAPERPGPEESQIFS